MSDQPEALRLADALLGCFDPQFRYVPVASCLLRQHAEIEALKAECDALRAEVSALQSQVNVFYLGTPESRLLAMTKERDALLEFAKAALRYASNAGDDYLAEKARAAIDAAREAGK